MKKMFEQLRDTLAAHVEQRDDLMLVLQMSGRYDVAYPLKYLEALEQATSRDIYLIHAQECVHAGDYFDGLMASCEMQVDAAFCSQ